MNGVKNMKKMDIIIASVLIAISLISFLFLRLNADYYYVEITHDSEVIEYFRLTDRVEKTIELDHTGHNVVVVKDGMVNMIEADCPDQLCVHMESITYDSWNPTIICAPNKIVVRIIGGDTVVDGIA